MEWGLFSGKLSNRRKNLGLKRQTTSPRRGGALKAGQAVKTWAVHCKLQDSTFQALIIQSFVDLVFNTYSVLCWGPGATGT